ncbi:MAG: zinc-ribbon domain-containing protein [Candidatus Sifarchaeia archaeon]
MVRNLYLNFLFRKENGRVEPEPESVCLAGALASADSLKGQSTRIVSLSRVSFPFWIVQTSPTKSIVLSATTSSRKEFHFTDMKGASEVKRIISSELTQATDISTVVSKMQPLLESVDSHATDIANLINPTFIKMIGDFVRASDPTAAPNRVEILTDSAAALKRTEEFRKISESTKLRIESAETLEKLIQENFGAQTTILDNITKLERERGIDRVQTMEDRTKQEIEKLTKEKDDKLYDLREKHMMNLRAMTADFSRSVNELEQFFTSIVDEIRKARSQISEKEADTEGAVTVYSNLVNSLKNTISKSQQPIDMMELKKEDLEKRVAEAQTRYESDRIKAEAMLQTEIQERQKRIDEVKYEMEIKAKELDNLKAQVKTSISQAEQTIGSRVIEFQQEFLDLMNWTLDNDSIRDLAPLTLLDIHTYVVKYDDKSHRLLTPSFVPMDSLLNMGTGNALNNEFDAALTALIDDWLNNDRSFRESFERACTKGNMLLTPEAEQLLVEGLEELLRRRLLQRDDIERVLTLWSKYTSKCPKCGAVIDVGAQFCQKCGMELTV